MIRNITNTIVGIMLLTPACVAIAGEIGMSYDGTGNPGDPPPHIAPPGGGDSPKPLSTNTTPIPSLGGGAQPQARNLPREVQPGEETPQTDDNTAGSGDLRPPRGSLTKGGGGSVSSGDEDDIEDLEVERLTVQGVDKPGISSEGSGSPPPREVQPGEEKPQVDVPSPSAGGVSPPRGGLTKGGGTDGGTGGTDGGTGGTDGGTGGTDGGSGNGGYSPGGGDGTQTEDELYVGRKLKDTPTPGDVSTGSAGGIGGGQVGLPPIRRKPSGLDSVLPAQGSVVKLAPTASIKPAAQRPAPTRQNWGTVWTGYIDDPNANVNPCQKGLERGEQRQVKTYKSGDTTLYDVNYQCYLLVPAPRPAVASATLRENCGTFWTGWIDDPDVEVNPCPKGCERGEQRSIKADVSAAGKQYDVNYQCYVAAPN